MKTRIIHPHKTESYRVGYDDHCLVVSEGSNNKNDKKVYLSRSMIEWLYHKGLNTKAMRKYD